MVDIEKKTFSIHFKNKNLYINDILKINET